MSETCVFCSELVGDNESVCINCEDMAFCVACGKQFMIGQDGNELGLCLKCGKQFDLDKYYKDYEENKVAFKGFDTLGRGLLEPYRKEQKETPQEWLDNLFEFELCSECGKDKEDHEVILFLGNYFARCKGEVKED